MGISQKVPNAERSSYQKFQIILCKTGVAPKGFCLVQAGLKWAFCAENREVVGLRHFKSKKQKSSINQCRNNFLTSDEISSNFFFFALSLVWRPSIIIIFMYKQTGRHAAHKYRMSQKDVLRFLAVIYCFGPWPDNWQLVSWKLAPKDTETAEFKVRCTSWNTVLCRSDDKSPNLATLVI